MIIALLSNAWAQHAVVSSDEAHSPTSRGADTLVRWNISPAALQHMRSESFKRQFSPWGGKRNAAAFESLMDSPGEQQSHRHQLAADASYKVRRLHHTGSLRNADSFSPWGGKRADDKKDKDQTFNPWGGKRASGDRFGAWGGKRGTFSAWGGKRQQESKNAFSPWGGKRAVRSPLARSEGTARARQDDGEEDEERTFAPWGGKRGAAEDQAFSPWGGKRGDDGDTSFAPWGGKREDRFNPWGGKREGPFNPWGGKRDGSNKEGFFNPWGGKRGADDSFNPWGGKRQDSFNPWGGKREGGVFRPWGGKKEDNVFRPWGGKKEDDVFGPWGGKREEGSPPSSFSVGRGFSYGGAAGHSLDGGSLRKKRDSSMSDHRVTTSYSGKSGGT